MYDNYDDNNDNISYGNCSFRVPLHTYGNLEDINFDNGIGGGGGGEGGAGGSGENDFEDPFNNMFFNENNGTDYIFYNCKEYEEDLCAAKRIRRNQYKILKSYENCCCDKKSSICSSSSSSCKGCTTSCSTKQKSKSKKNKKKYIKLISKSSSSSSNCTSSCPSKCSISQSSCSCSCSCSSTSKYCLTRCEISS